MCGIVGVVSQRNNVVPILLEGLNRLEYRGYDSSGLVVVTEQNKLHRVRRVGKVRFLEEGIADSCIHGSTGIAHTRWATHGAPTENNAHPHIVGNRIAVVHNGIIENYSALKNSLQNNNITFNSDTDSEVIAASIYSHVQQGLDILAAVQKTARLLEGAYAICVLDSEHPNRVVLARCGSPIAIGLGISEYFVASDPLALQKVSQEFIYLEDHDIADITSDSLTIYNLSGIKTTRAVHSKSLSIEAVDKGKYRHFMQKEIFEQSRAILSTMSGRVSHGHVLEESFGRMAKEIFAATKQVVFIACGTSYYAGMVACYWMESLAGIPCRVEIASEFRYKKRVMLPGTLMVAISQSGETADTIAAIRDKTRDAKGTYCGTLAICNVPESTLVRESDLVFLTNAGPEIGVASTKAFVTQLTALFLLTMVVGRHAGLSKDAVSGWLAQLSVLPKTVEEFLNLDKKINHLANIFIDKSHALFLGRGLHFPIALEGALKLKEISYIHAEAYPAGELKHGPLALVDADMPVVVVAPGDHLIDKLKSNIQEVQARGGELIVVTSKGVNIKSSRRLHVLTVPETPGWLSPIPYVIPLQLLAYHVAVLKGTDVDQPRNLAKSVTVE